MYYLDFFSLHTRTKKDERVEVRRTLNRDAEMALKLKYQRNLCFWCGTDIDMSGHLDHVIPIYYGGTNRSRNLVASCRRCNLTKGTSQIEITSEWTIREYQKLIDAKAKWEAKLLRAGRTSAKHVPKKVQLYSVYRADLFNSI